MNVARLLYLSANIDLVFFRLYEYQGRSLLKGFGMRSPTALHEASPEGAGRESEGLRFPLVIEAQMAAG